MDTKILGGRSHFSTGMDKTRLHRSVGSSCIRDITESRKLGNGWMLIISPFVSSETQCHLNSLGVFLLDSVPILQSLAIQGTFLIVNGNANLHPIHNKHESLKRDANP